MARRPFLFRYMIVQSKTGGLQYPGQNRPSSIRGRLMTLQQHSPPAGALSCSTGLKGHPAEWRPILGIQMSTIEQNTSVICNPTVDHSRPAIDLIHLTAPESPRWLAEKGHTEEGQQFCSAYQECPDESESNAAQATLARLHGHGDIRDPSWSELFTVSSNFRRLSLGCQYYATTIFTTVRVPDIDTPKLDAQPPHRRVSVLCCGRNLDGEVTGTVKNNAVFILTTWVFNFFFSACIAPQEPEPRRPQLRILHPGFPTFELSLPAILLVARWISGNEPPDLVFVICVHTKSVAPLSSIVDYVILAALCSSGHSSLNPRLVASRRWTLCSKMHHSLYRERVTQKWEITAPPRELRQGTFRLGDLTERAPHTQAEEDGKASNGEDRVEKNWTNNESRASPTQACQTYVDFLYNSIIVECSPVVWWNADPMGIAARQAAYRMSQVSDDPSFPRRGRGFGL
ncbi:hypothetical protein C8R44DRAFT_911387 [Mycena epipterygia]|nr:hypothetical protein C8R44DRAFT_911387 [Mycena epipterygia]